MRKRSLIALLAAFATASPAATITVNATADAVADDGVCTLREAIAAVNTNAASGTTPGECAAGDAPPIVDTIAFAIPDGDRGCSGETHVCTIAPATDLAVVSNPVLIDGYAQPGSSANTLTIGDDAALRVEIDGSALNTVLRFSGAAAGAGNDASGSSVRGLVIDHLASVAIGCAGFGNCANAIALTGNFLGVDASGTAINGSASALAIYVQTTSGIVIGGEPVADRNLIGNSVELDLCSDGRVQNNYFGTDRTGSVALTPPPTNALVIGNSDNFLVGGAGLGNVFGSWGASAIQIASANSNFEPPNAILVQGNFVGADATGTVPLATGEIGINVGVTIGNTGAGTGNVVGGSAPGEGNVVAGAAIAGISAQTDETDLVIEGNAIGSDATGTRLLPNNAGIMAGGGGTIDGNLVAFNRGIGIAISGNATRYAMLGNAIYANALLGISLGNGAPTPNDDGDADTGPNGLQNYPVVSVVTINPRTAVHVSGTLNSTADTTFHLEFFANAACHPSGNGEGKIFLGALDATTSGNDATFGPVDFEVPADRHVITATATDPDGNTSEFSACGLQDTIFSDGFDGD